MIKTVHGDVLAESNCVIAHCVNCLGVMGGGIARQIRAEYPEAYDVYRETLDNDLLVLGSVSYAYIPASESMGHKIIANAAGQEKTGFPERQAD